MAAEVQSDERAVAYLVVGVAGVHVARDHGETAAVGGGHIGFDPATRVVVELGRGVARKTRAALGDGDATGHGDAGSPLAGRGCVGDVPAGAAGLVHQIGHHLVGGAHLLHGDHVGVPFGHPRGHATGDGGPQSVHVHRGDDERLAGRHGRRG